ncbi:MAG: Brp/Blh family beta-carotene 15,15'-dioxygenase [Planctomycetota bacterium]
MVDARTQPWVLAWLAGAAIACVVFPGVAESWHAWPFVVALLLFGMPHGAADWVVLARIRQTAGPLGTLAAFVPYCGWIALSAAVLFVAPVWGVLVFLALTVIHFGMADAHALGRSLGGRVESAWRYCTAVARGSVLLGGVFWAAPIAAWAPFEALIVGYIGPGHGAIDPATASVWGGVAAGVGVVLALVAAALRIGGGASRLAVFVDLAEHGLTLALAVVAPPLLAVGLYFIGVHAVRHTARLGDEAWLDPERPLPPSRFGRLIRVHRLSLPLLLASLPLVALLAVPLPGTLAERVAIGSIGFYMLTTLPHHLLGLRLPSRETGAASAIRPTVNASVGPLATTG